MKLVWDDLGKRIYETGVQNGVLYPRNKQTGVYPLGVVWNGLISVKENPSGAEATSLYADNIEYLKLVSAEKFGATVEAYTYPDEFAACDGSEEIAPGVFIGQQNRQAFGLVYKTLLGNDLEDTNYGYKLHMIWNALASPSEKSYSTVNENPEAMTLSWELTTTPTTVPGYKPTAAMTIDSTKVSSTVLSELEEILFGTDGDDEPGTTARLPMPSEIIAMFSQG